MPSTRPTPTTRDTDVPRIARHVRLSFDRSRDRHVLLSPETVVVLNATGHAILDLCDGQRTVAQIVAELGARYDNVDAEGVRTYLGQLVARRLVDITSGETDG